MKKEDKQKTAGVIAFPPLIYGAALAASIGADYLLARKPLPRATQALAVGFFLAAGMMVAPSFGAFKKAGTTVDVFEETTALVETGPYEHTRNPIYIGLTSLYLAAAFASRRRTPLVVLPAILWLMNAGVIEREERYLEAKFGKKYREYMQRVPRWL